MDKAIEIMKAAMEKEKAMKEMAKEPMDQNIDEATQEVWKEEPDTEAAAAATGELPVPADEASEAENTCEAEDVEVCEEAEGKKQGKSFFKGMKSKDLAAKDQKIEDLTDRLMRTMAEFDNYRKRTEKEKTTMYDMGIKSVIEKLLPIVDNFERGLGTIAETEKQDAFAQGIELIYRQLVTALEQIGLKPIEAVGKEFDPNLHNAVMHGEDENQGENIITDEFQKGYIYHDMVVRHSMVKVVN